MRRNRSRVDRSGSASRALDGPFSDPLANWPNDDLMLEKKTRELVERHHPALYSLLDWPELRALFTRYEALTVPAKRRDQRHGLGVVLLGVVGLFFAAGVALLPEESDLARTIGAIAAFASAVSLGLGFRQLLGNASRRQWLRARYVTERLRQFYFQFLLAHLDEASRASEEAAALATYRERRTRAFERFGAERIGDSGLVQCYSDLLNDVAESDFWIPEAGKPPMQVPTGATLVAETERLDELLSVLRRQRIGIQARYVTLKNVPSAHTEATRAVVAARAADTLTVLVMILALLTGVRALIPATDDQFGLVTLETLVVIGACLSAVIAGLRALAAGLRLGEESDRYRWYGEAVAEVGRRFDAADSRAARVAALVALERLSYRELRRFLLSQRHARFLIQ